MLIVPEPQMPIEVVVAEMLAMIIAAEIWLLIGGLRKRWGGKDGP